MNELGQGAAQPAFRDVGKDVAWDVFLSYAAENTEWVRSFETRLKSQGLKVFDPYSTPTEYWGQDRNEIVAAVGSYPAPYRDILLKAVKGRDVDPRLVLAIMRQESSFNAHARSPAAARGLLQLTMDIVAKYGAGAGQANATEDDLYRPEVNIPVGVEYLADLTRMFPNLPEAVAASYNGGEDNVARWVKRATQKDPGVFTAEIGFTESKDYAFKVMANYRAYKQLYTADLRRQR